MIEKDANLKITLCRAEGPLPKYIPEAQTGISHTFDNFEDAEKFFQGIAMYVGRGADKVDYTIEFPNQGVQSSGTIPMRQSDQHYSDNVSYKINSDFNFQAGNTSSHLNIPLENKEMAKKVLENCYLGTFDKSKNLTPENVDYVILSGHKSTQGIYYFLINTKEEIPAYKQHDDEVPTLVALKGFVGDGQELEFIGHDEFNKKEEMMDLVDNLWTSGDYQNSKIKKDILNSIYNTLKTEIEIENVSNVYKTKYIENDLDSRLRM